jgi:uncharacterized protein with GYD domain
MFTPAMVKAIRENKQRMTTRELANLYGCSHVHIIRTIRGDYYKDIREEVADQVAAIQADLEAFERGMTDLATDNAEIAVRVLEALKNRAPSKEIRVWLAGEIGMLKEEAGL